MDVFFDTSAIFAVLGGSDASRTKAHRTWTELVDGLSEGKVRLVTTNYVVVETCALLQSRIGLAAVRVFLDDVLQVSEIVWITPAQHIAAVQVMVAANRRKLSLVDCATLAAIRDRGIRKAFAFDDHFREQGFEDATLKK